MKGNWLGGVVRTVGIVVAGLVALLAAPHAAMAERVSLVPPWSWSGPSPGARAALVPSVEALTPTGGRCSFATVPGQRGSLLRCVDARGRSMWSTVDANAGSFAGAALVVEGATLYVVRYHHFATGAVASAYDVATGAVRWTSRLQGLGPIGHSEYFNEVRVSWVRGVLVVFGWESAGRYVEVLDPASGRTMETRRLPAQP